METVALLRFGSLFCCSAWFALLGFGSAWVGCEVETRVCLLAREASTRVLMDRDLSVASVTTQTMPSAQYGVVQATFTGRPRAVSVRYSVTDTLRWQGPRDVPGLEF